MSPKKSTFKKVSREGVEVVGVEILETGDLARPNRKVRTWRISTGIYQVEFVGVKKINTVMVSFKPKSKPLRCLAWVRPLPMHRAKKDDLQRVEITIRNSKGVLIDREFGVATVSIPIFTNQPSVSE